ncbi:MAG: recombinase family protein [Candidatus Zixiibacteriota bacterium]
MKEKAAVYFRCSTDKQDQSIPDQRRKVEEFALTNNMEIVSWFDKDEGKSGTSFEKRPDFMKMVSVIESRGTPFSKVLVYDVDRWGRPIDPHESTYWEYHCKRFGVEIVYVNDLSVNDHTMAGRLTKAIKQELATEESRKQSLRVRERSKLRASEGYRVGGFAPYGYKRLLMDKMGNPVKVLEDGERKYEKEQRVILTPGDKREIEVVRRIFEMRTKGESILSIANTLNRDGISSPDHNKPRRKTNHPGKWCVNTVWRILANPVYKGDLLYNRTARGNWVKYENSGQILHEVGEWVRKSEAFEGIISQDVFERVNRNRRKLSYNVGRGSGSNYLLSGLLICQNCGYSFHGHQHRNEYGAWKYYEDSGYARRGSSVCTSFHIPKDSIEEFVIKEIKKKILSSVNLERLPGLIKKRLKDLNERKSPAVQEMDRELADIQRKIENIKDSIEKGVDVDLIKDRLEKLDKRRIVLEGEKIAISSPAQAEFDVDKAIQEILEPVNHLQDVLMSGADKEKKQRIRSFVAKIEVNPTERKATCYIHKIPKTLTFSSIPTSGINSKLTIKTSTLYLP